MARFFVHRYFYPHIFSLEKKEVVLYGAGTIGQDYYAQLSQYQKCRVVAWVDKNALKYKNEYVDIIEPKELKYVRYDIVILAVKEYQMAEEIKAELIEGGISKNKITWSTPKYMSY